MNKLSQNGVARGRPSVADWNRSLDTVWASAACMTGFAPEGPSGFSQPVNVPEEEELDYEFPHAIARLVTDMRHCFEDLTGSKNGLASSQADANRAIERAAILIHESMSAPSRTFHTVQHVYDVQDFVANSTQKLAAFFHDIVYYTIDGGLSSLQSEFLKGVIVEEDGKIVRLADTICRDDRKISLVMRCFGFNPGQILNPFSGLNEVLSAAAAVRCLGSLLSETHLLQISACIEATIPFRKPDEDGKTCSDLLYERLYSINEEMNLGMTNAEVVKTTQDAVILANSDVKSFATTDHACFLSGTWKLLPETNITLRTDDRCYISDFTLALHKMLGFLSNLDPAVIYESFENVPDSQHIAMLRVRAQNNLDISTKYLQLKVLAMSVIAALAELTGGDAPLVMFIRGISVPYDSSAFGLEEMDEGDEKHDEFEESIEIRGNRKQTTSNISRTSVIPNFGIVRKSQASDRSDVVYDLLKKGRGSTSSFDLVNAPLAAYLYGVIGDTGSSKALPYCVCPMDATNAKFLLDSLPPEVVRVLAKACSMTALTRTEELLAIVEAYSS